MTVFDLVIRHRLRKRLHMLRSKGACMRKVVAVGHAPAVADLVGELRRGTYHGLSVVGACLAGGSMLHEIAGIPVYGGLDSVTTAVGQFGADTVAVLACPEMNGMRLRSWPGTWRRPAPTCTWRRPCSTWPARAPPSGRSPG